MLLTIIRYQYFKTNRQENIVAYLLNLIVINLMMTGILVKGNLMYFSDSNLCGYAEDSLTYVSYRTFCLVIFLGYIQFIYCILLSFYLPLIGFIIYQLV